MKKTATQVHFSINDALLQGLMDTAEEKSKRNLRLFEDRLVLVEGGGYEKIWLETQPMGGEMYAKRNLEAALNNQLLFMEYRREDGRIPGSITVLDGKITPQYDKLQGFCFPAPALNIYYLTGKDSGYLTLLADSLRGFDEYLWRVRDSDGDGCLETWCKYDTGEDHAVRYADAPDAWAADVPPKGCKAVPMASIDVMSYSYSCRDTLSKICHIRGEETESAFWAKKAEAVKAKIRSYLWNEERGACLDRDKNHNVMPVLMHNTLRAMYWGSIAPDLAARFVQEHLTNSAEFWTKMPLPSVAVNDPLFRNVITNDWSGQVEALTYQRAIRALENYGYYSLIPQLGQKLFHAIGSQCRFVQQYDPFTMKPSTVRLESEQDSYGPAMLSVMEYTACMYGVRRIGDTLIWGTVSGSECRYTQQMGEQCWRIENSGRGAEAFVNGRKMFRAGPDLRIVTDLAGNLLRADPYAPGAKSDAVAQL